ncbi:phage head-tail joining protein [Tritonibacter mobilis]|uniref:phage head-tail joining protein n=1 Tax=Tritonibacter mobilis TaxID=379347 RepID=UPI0039A6B978
MADVATMQARLEALEELKASGVLSTTYEGKKVEYRSMSDLNMAITSLENKIAAATRTRRGAVGVIHFSRG